MSCAKKTDGCNLRAQRLQRNQAPTLQIFLPRGIPTPLAHQASLASHRHPRLTARLSQQRPIPYNLIKCMSHMSPSLPPRQANKKASLAYFVLCLSLILSLSLSSTLAHLSTARQTTNTVTTTNPNNVQQRPNNVQQRKKPHKTHRLAFSSGRKMCTESSSWAKAFKPSKQLWP